MPVKAAQSVSAPQRSNLSFRSESRQPLAMKDREGCCALRRTAAIVLARRNSAMDNPEVSWLAMGESGIDSPDCGLRPRELSAKHACFRLGREPNHAQLRVL